MPRVLDLPNVEAAVNVGLQATGLRVYSSIPAKSPSFPLVVTFRAGGRPAEKHSIDAPRIQVEVWGETSTSKSELLNYARDAWRELLELEGETVELSDDEAVFISSVDPEIGFQWLPDPPTGRPRYIASVRVYARQSDRSS
jgi:hypothetical protein